MGLTRLDSEKLAQEVEVQRKIDRCVARNEDFVFNAGAGAGKTHSLITTLKNLLKTKGYELARQNKSVICITYTNAATNEIRERLGGSDIVKVSTIHERMWQIIHQQQPALLDAHREKIQSEIAAIEQELTSQAKHSLFTTLLPNNKIKFVEYMLANKDDFYRLKGGPAAPLKDRFRNSLLEFDYTLSNVGHFKATVSKVIKQTRLTSCLISMANGEDKFKKVRYDANYNSDRLHYMLISHDTLLEYASKLISDYPLLRAMVVDSYPYIFIDEYQDASENIIMIANDLSTYAKENGKNFVVGYFGDSMQNIYETGVGSKLQIIHPELTDVTKIYNRRSHLEIINISNELRNDAVQQESIFSDDRGGSFHFYTTSASLNQEPQVLANNFIGEYRKKCNLDDDDVIDCLVLTNSTVAKLAEFPDLYTSLESFFFHTDRAQKIISTDIEKLDECVRMLYRTIELKLIADNSNKLKLIEILPKSMKGNITLDEADSYISNLRSGCGQHNDQQLFRSLFEKIFDVYKSKQVSQIFKQRIEEVFSEQLGEHSIEGVIEWLNENLPTTESLDDEARRLKIDQVLNVPLHQYNNWYQHLVGSSDKKIRFHTYHSAKGLEYKNVIIFIQNRFANKPNYFPDFFKTPNADESQKKRNLLYVACSRAIDNLAILYADDIATFDKEIAKFFGSPEVFTVT
ncbi:MAG: DNA helicase-2/ATP-dependent DNA helicase PcrA [Flavobacteriales bacterium]|jgi:DNA helicase-2/ATP-dependent DNA helicase PcrA